MPSAASQEEIFGWVSEVLQKEFDFPGDQLELDTHLIEELDLDSIDAIDLAVRLEERTSISFSDEDLKAIRTIRDIVSLIDGRLDAPTDDGSESTQWTRLGERGSLLGIRFMAWCYRLLGRRGSLPLVLAVVTYFFLTDTKGRRASTSYLRRIHAHPAGRRAVPSSPGLRESYRHYRSFAIAILDRMAIWFGDMDSFSFENHGNENIDQYTEAGRGALILGAHVGSFDVLRKMALDSDMRVNVVMFTANAERINRVFREISPEAGAMVIPVDPASVQSVFAIRERLRSGEHVAILADRIEVGDRDRSLPIPLLGGLVQLPQAPILMAGLLGCPVLMVMALRDGPREYSVFTERLAERVVLPREGRDAAVAEFLTVYAERLEHYCLRSPYQWFNFFDYWGDAPPGDAEK